MPYRRLPNTDLARMRALRAALGKDPQGEVITPALQQEASAFLSQMEKTHRYYRACCENQAKAKRKHQESLRVARLYVSHFIQVLNLAVIRSEVRRAHKELYGLDPKSNTIPDLTSEAALVDWGRKIIEGENKRIAQGGIPIYNPTIAKVKVHYDIFYESYSRQKNLQMLTERSLNELSAMRPEADALILNVWNQVEKKFEFVTPNEKRLEACRKYGMIYYYRTSEKLKAEEKKSCPLFPSMQL